MEKLTLVSHKLCPYVQRAAISLSEKNVPYERIDVDLADKPAWFLALSPLGKTPVLKCDDQAIFESAVILEFLEETQPRPLHPTDPLRRARHRAWIEFGSALLNDIGGFYASPDKTGFDVKTHALEAKFARVEEQLDEGPWFDGADFCLVDAVFGPIFRYFDTFDRVGDFGILSSKPKLAAWRTALAGRHSIKTAVSEDYDARLRDFLLRRKSYLSSLMLQKVH